MLDLGCGYGVVGILAYRLIGRRTTQVFFDQFGSDSYSHRNELPCSDESMSISPREFSMWPDC